MRKIGDQTLRDNDREGTAGRREIKQAAIRAWESISVSHHTMGMQTWEREKQS